MNIVAYADETGTHDPTGGERGAEIAGITGYVGWSDDWKNFCCEWQEVLDKYKVPYFHFSEFANQENRSGDRSWAYYHLDKTQRDRFPIELASVAHKWTQNGFCIGGFFRVDDYNRTMPNWFNEIEPSPYGLCFMIFYEALLSQIRKQWIYGDTQVQFVFDQNQNNPQWSNLAHKWRRISKYQSDFDDRLGTITFADMRKVLPLQAADMVAYFARQQFTNALHGRQICRNEFAKSLRRKPKNENILQCTREYLTGVATELERRKRELLEAFAEDQNEQKSERRSI